VRTDRGRFGTMPIYELASLPPGEWLIKGVLPDADLAILFGASGSGKTFVALDMAFAVAMGLPWRGNRVKQGKVVIIAAEGSGGLGKRASAYAQFHGIDLRESNLHVIPAAPNFLRGGHRRGARLHQGTRRRGPRGGRYPRAGHARRE
jgi:hypothetical protein